MKTKGITNLLFILVISIAITSCKEEEFLEKDYIDTLQDQYERENLPDDIAELPWEDLDGDGKPDLPEVLPTPGDGGTIPGDDGTTPGDDGTTPGDDGTTPGDDGTTPGDDGTNPGDDGTNPGDDGTNPGDDGTNPGDDGTNPGDDDTTPTVNLKEASDEFKQEASGQKVDILWVIDNSGSMGDEQKALGENFDSFIKEFVEKGVDFQMAVTTTDTQKNNAGKEYKDSIARLTAAKLAENKDQFMTDFKDMVKVGTRGSGWEKGIKASEVFTNRFQNKWLRDDAYYAIVYVSDEADQSEKEVADHLKQITKWKTNANLVKAYSIIDNTQSRSNFSRRGGIIRGAERYTEISETTGGSVASIKGSFHETLLEMGSQIATLTTQFSLSSVPYDTTDIKVLVDGVEVSGWDYIVDSNSIKFQEDSVPSNNAQIEVIYSLEDK